MLDSITRVDLYQNISIMTFSYSQFHNHMETIYQQRVFVDKEELSRNVERIEFINETRSL